MTRLWNWGTRRVPRTAIAILGKDQCPGCLARKDSIGRFEPGFCGPLCMVRQARDKWIAANR